jgi:putative toxin-antitoxin system antitoxin component (TIGR02293 family)
MASLHGPTPTSKEQLAAQLEHPNSQAIWSRALEVFGDEGKARSWMTSPRDLLGGRTPQELVATGDVQEQRRVLELLLRIDYGVFS